MKYAYWVLTWVLGSAVGGLAAPANKAGGSAAQPMVAAVAAPPAGLTGAAKAAQARLDEAVKELSSVREVISSEKLPLSAELSGIENGLADVRKRADAAAAAVDQKNLELSTAKAALKNKEQEELYLRSLLDEYLRNFEGSISPAEMQVYQRGAVEAIAAPSNKNLAPARAVEVQLAFLDRSVTRIGKLVGGTRVGGEATDSMGQVKKGTFVLVGPMAVFNSEDNKTSGIVGKKAGSDIPPVIALPDSGANKAIRTLASAGEGLLPVDPTVGGALQKILHDNGALYYFKKGGPIMWPILICAIGALTVVMERLLFISTERRKRDYGIVKQVVEAARNQGVEAAIRVAHGTQDFIGKALGYALEHRGSSFDDALQRASQLAIHRFTRGLVVLDTIITAAPLLGLLGTVTGMMASFGLMGESELGAPTAITGGIAEALIATAAGLGIAITCLLPYNYLTRESEVARHEMEDAGAQLSLVMKAGQGPSSPLPTHAPSSAASSAPIRVAV